VEELIKKYWPVFDKKVIFNTVKNYECVIDTGDAKPIAVKKILYGPKEIPIMWNAIAALEKVGNIQQIYDGPWLFKVLLAPKPQQEHVRDIDNFVWRFCINCILLNSVTKIVAYPIPCCDLAVNEEFGLGMFF
jgi:hypothetical protein